MTNWTTPRTYIDENGEWKNEYARPLRQPKARVSTPEEIAAEEARVEAMFAEFEGV